MAMQWWGTVNLPAVVAARCNDPCHHRASTSRFAADGAVAHMAHREETGVGWVGMDGWIGTGFGDFID